jgi:SAM-dependent methyltransferase
VPRDSWDAFAAREPYFAVLTQPRYLRANFDAAARDEFFNGGEGQVAELFSAIRMHVHPEFAPQSVLEYGCGVGRLLIPFARRGAETVGVDRSESMLAIARRHLDEAGHQNVNLLTVNQLTNDRRTFDMVNLFLVLQRMQKREGLDLVRDLAKRVRPGGVFVVQFPYRAYVSPAVSLARKLRAHVPAVNALINAARRKPADEPFIASQLYDRSEIYDILAAEGFHPPHATFHRQGDLDSMIVYARRAGEVPRGEIKPPVADERAAEFIDVRKLIAQTSIEELNRTAEQYFASLTNWDDHLAKPFSRAEDAPQLLINTGILLQGLSLIPGMTVLEYGAGTGWLSRFLTQLGCRAILLDVSPTALNIARELYKRQPPIGNRPEPRFLVFDGHRIELEDASVDRVICFDAFHHAANPEEILAEFSRVLKPAGFAAFVEPGPMHSKMPQSQYEMRTYRVLENDIDVHALWKSAESAGFAEMKLAAFNIPPFHVSLREYDELLAGGDTMLRWAHASRDFLHHVRTFFLFKGGTAEIDSRRPEGLRAEIEAAVLSVSPLRLEATIRNTGSAKWLPSDEYYGGVVLGGHLYGARGELVKFDYAWQVLPKPLAPNEELTFAFEPPPLEPGRWIIELDCVANQIRWFAQIGSPAARVEVDVP